MKVTILGCGTSGGVPSITGTWGACDPTDPRNRRRRVSIMVEQAGSRLIVDTSPDLREQCLSAGIDRLDAVLLTHDHADHTHGIDDLRGIAGRMRRRVPVHADARTVATLRRRFDYIFEDTLGYPAICDAHVIDGPFRVGAIPVVPFRQHHGEIDSLGFRFGGVAYSTDLVDLPAESWPVVSGLDLWIVDALRYEPHPTHAHLDLTLQWIARARPKRAILTHMNWDMDYAALAARLPAGVEPGIDGLAVDIPDAP
jgi:phosphoribosyl 1,2-cyclic phosphate phosphodiesterase